MISAEYYALDQSAVQSLIAIRARELDHILDRFNNMGTQAALMAGFAITTITAIDVTGHETRDAVQHFFFASSSVCVAASMHSIIMTTYLANWGPGLALRGPRGSVSRAYVAMMSERNNVEFSFSIAVVFFIMQTILAIWSLDGSRKATFDCIAGTVILGGGACATFIYLYQCKLRLHFDDSTPLDMGTPSANTGTQGAGSGGGGGASGGRDDGSRHEMEAPLVMAGDHPDLHTGRSASRDAADANFLAGGSVAVEGYLMKRSTRAAAGGSTSVQSALGVAAFKRRFFVLEGTELRYWATKEDFERRLPPRSEDEPIELDGYGILVDQRGGFGGSAHGFTLYPLRKGDRRRRLDLRATSEPERANWVRALLTATMLAQPGGDANHQHTRA